MEALKFSTSHPEKRPAATVSLASKCHRRFDPIVVSGQHSCSVKDLNRIHELAHFKQGFQPMNMPIVMSEGKIWDEMTNRIRKAESRVCEERERE